MSVFPGSLRCEHRDNPVGIDIAVPRFSWKLTAEKPDARGVRQSAYRIQAGTMPGLGDLWDTERVESEESVLVVWNGPKLLSRQRVYWRVKVWDGEGKSSKWSDDAHFEMGLLRPSEWRGARWIGGTLAGSPSASVPLPKLRRVFPLDKPVVAARLYATALGVYEARINGVKVGTDELAPGWTDYGHRVRYQTADVGGLLQIGGNEISVELGDGWAAGHVGWNARATYADRPQFFGLLIAVHPDGSETAIRTDGRWEAAYGPRLAADLLMGETFDARRSWDGWNRANVFPSPAKMVLEAQNGPAIEITEELTPIKPPYKHGGSWIFDLGINMVGRIRLKATGKSGAEIKIRYAEVLEKGPLATDGPIYTKNLRSALNTDYFTLSGDEKGEIFEPKFAFHGFRYVEVSGLADEPDKNTVTGLVMHSQCLPTGTFTCSDPMIEQLQKNIDWGWRGNSLDVPTDCPQRDERLGWTGDAQVFCRTACFLRDTVGFWDKWMGDLRDSQGPGGELPMVSPNSGLGIDGGPAWADAGVIVPWTVYLAYGDTRILSENYDLMKRFVEFWIRTAKDNIRCYPGYEKEGGWPGFGDWLALDGSGKTDGGTPKEIIGTAYLAYSSRLLSKIAAVLGKTGDSRKYQGVYERTKAAFTKRFVTGEGLVAPMTQTAAVLALHFDLVPQNLRAKVADWLASDIESRGGKTTCGFVGSSYQPHVLSAEGKLAAAESLLFQKGWPSYLYAVTQGATTIWERWDGWTAEKGFQDAGMNSFNHYAYGAVGSWLYQVAAGLDTAEDGPGYKKLVLRPRILDGLTHARATLETPYGHAESGWERRKKTLRWKVVVPPNATALAYLPLQPGQSVAQNVIENGKPLEKAAGVTILQGDTVALASGTYEFEIAR